MRLLVLLLFVLLDVEVESPRPETLESVDDVDVCEAEALVLVKETVLEEEVVVEETVVDETIAEVVNKEETIKVEVCVVVDSGVVVVEEEDLEVLKVVAAKVVLVEETVSQIAFTRLLLKTMPSNVEELILVPEHAVLTSSWTFLREETQALEQVFPTAKSAIEQEGMIASYAMRHFSDTAVADTV